MPVNMSRYTGQSVLVETGLFDPKETNDRVHLFRLSQILSLLLDTTSTGIFWKNRDSIFLGCNQVLARMAGVESPAEIIGKRDDDMPWSDRGEFFRAEDLEVMQTRSAHLDVVQQVAERGGNCRWIRSNKIPLLDVDGEVVGVIGTFEDLTDLQKAEEEIARSNETLKVWLSDLEARNAEAALLRQMGELLQVCTDTAECFAVVQQYGPLLFPSFPGALLLSNDSLRGVETVAGWGQGLQTDRVFPAEECWSLRRGQVHQVQSGAAGLRCRHLPPLFEGGYLEIPMSAGGETIGLLYLEDPSGGGITSQTVELARTMSDNLALSLTNIRLRESLRAQSIRDPLTGLFNRRYMEETIDRESHRALRKQATIGVIMVDIDHFKRINDTFGHEAGDNVLCTVAHLLRHQVRSADIACRYGGEEFILILPEASLDITARRAEQIREAVKGLSLSYQGKTIPAVTVSIGVALFPEHHSDIQQVVRLADEALYRAKRNGRDRVELAVPAPISQASEPDAL